MDYEHCYETGEYTDEFCELCPHKHECSSYEYSDKEVIGVAYNEEIAKAYAKLHYGYVETADIITDRNYITKANKK